MPVNKSAIRRYEIIDECLRNSSRKWSKADLLNRVNERLEDTGVSESTIRNDISGMQSTFGAPIESYKEGRVVYYRYEDPSFSIKDIPLKDEELALLVETEDLIREMGLPLADYFSSVVQKLMQRAPMGIEDRKVIYPERQSFEGQQYLIDLYEAIIRKCVLKVSYIKLHAVQPKDYLIHPYAVKEYQKRWYLWGYSEERNAPRTLALDRIRGVWVVNLQYKENSFMSVEDYFRHVLGVTVYPNSKPVDIALWFSAAVAPLIVTKPLHDSQFVENNDSTGLFVKLHLVINPELISTVLSYGSDTRVIYPEELRAQVKDKILDMCKHY